MRNNKLSVRAVVYGLLGFSVMPTMALADPLADALPVTQQPDLTIEKRRFQPYEPNYGIWQVSDDNDAALEARYSFKYLLTRPDCSPNNLDRDESSTDFERSQAGSGKAFDDCASEWPRRWETYLKFTGEFDFFLGTRDSDPVINRRSNPGWHVRKYLANKKWMNTYWRHLDVGLEHLSNGQTVDDDDGCDTGLCTGQEIYAQDPHDPYFDEISRSLNFLSVEAAMRVGPRRERADPETGRCDGSAGCFDLWIRLIPWYISDDNLVTWGPNAGRRRIAEYDRARIIWSMKRKWRDYAAQRTGFNEMELTVKWTLGDDYFSTDSLDVGFFIPWQRGRFRLPLYLEAHFGPMNNLSNYTQTERTFGIGLRFN